MGGRERNNGGGYGVILGLSRKYSSPAFGRGGAPAKVAREGAGDSGFAYLLCWQLCSL